MITLQNSKKFLALALVAAAASMVPFAEAFAQIGAAETTNQVATKLAENTFNIPKLLAFGCYIIGTFFAIKALFGLKGFIESPDDNGIAPVMANAAVGALLILLPYILQVATTTIGADAGTVADSTDKFQAQGLR